MSYKSTRAYHVDLQTIFEIIKDIVATITLAKYLYGFFKRAKPHFCVLVKFVRRLGHFMYNTDYLDDGSNDYLGDCSWRASHSSTEARIFFGMLSILDRKDWESEYDLFNSLTKETKSMSILIKSPFVSLAEFDYTYPRLPKYLSRIPIQFVFRKT